MKNLLIILTFLIMGCDKEAPCTFTDYLDQTLQPDQANFDLIRFNSDNTIDYAWITGTDTLWIPKVDRWTETNDTIWYLPLSHIAWPMEIESDCNQIHILIDTPGETPPEYEWTLIKV